MNNTFLTVTERKRNDQVPRKRHAMNLNSVQSLKIQITAAMVKDPTGCSPLGYCFYLVSTSHGRAVYTVV